MDEENTTNKLYRVDLVQHEWVTTESFEYPAQTEEDAVKQAQDFVDEHKELEGREYRLEAVDITPVPEADPSEAAPTPEDANEAPDNSDNSTAEASANDV